MQDAQSCIVLPPQWGQVTTGMFAPPRCRYSFGFGKPIYHMMGCPVGHKTERFSQSIPEVEAGKMAERAGFEPAIIHLNA